MKKRQQEEAITQRKRSSRLAIKESEKEEARVVAIKKAEENEKLERARRAEARMKKEEDARKRREEKVTMAISIARDSSNTMSLPNISAMEKQPRRAIDDPWLTALMTRNVWDTRKITLRLPPHSKFAKGMRSLYWAADSRRRAEVAGSLNSKLVFLQTSERRCRHTRRSL